MGESLVNQSNTFRFSITGTSAIQPKKRVLSEEIDKRLGQPSGWTEKNFSIKQRYWAGPTETSSAMAAQAASQALAQAGWTGSDLDVIIGACGVMEQPIPGTASLVQSKMGLGQSGIPAFDVNATCLSFLLALQTAINGFVSGMWNKALIVGADIASAALNFDDPEASVIFGDGAFAVALERGGPSQLLAWQLATYGSGSELCQLQAGGTRLRLHDDPENFAANSRFQMDGPGVFKATSRRFPKFMKTLYQQAAISPDDLDNVIPHQASAPALEHLKRAIPGGHKKTVDIFQNYGNQIAVSLPTALHKALSDKRAGEPGSLSLLIGSSAGISLGGAVIKW